MGNAERQHPDQDDFTSRQNQIINNDILGGHYAGIHILKYVCNNRIDNNCIQGAVMMAIEDHNIKAVVVKARLSWHVRTLFSQLKKKFHARFIG